MSFVRDQTATHIIMRANTATDCMHKQDRSAGSCVVVIGVFRVTHELTAVQSQILHRLKNFYCELDNDHFVCNVIAQRSAVSLRASDWLVTNLSKKHNICLAASSVFNIHQNYKTALQQYRRRNFDPFRRRLRIQMSIDGQASDTTVGQLTFMHWAFESGVLAYARTHVRSIEEDMNETAAASKKRREREGEGESEKGSGSERKRNELSHAPKTKCNIFTAGVRVSFDHR